MDNLKIISTRVKGKSQEVQGVMVQNIGGKFEFNFQTAQDPKPEEIEMLKEFRNKFVNDLTALNENLKFLKDG